MNHRDLTVLSTFPIQLIKVIVACIVDIHGQDAEQLHLVAKICWCRFQSSADDLKYLQEAVRAGQESVNLTENENPNRRGRLEALAEYYHALYLRTGDPENIEMAVVTFGEAAGLPASLPHHTDPSLDGATPSIVHLGETDDELERKGAHASSKLDPQYGWTTVAAVFYHKGVTMGVRGQDVASITRGLSFMELALRIAPLPDYHQPAWLSNLVCKVHTELLWTGGASCVSLLKVLWDTASLFPIDWRRTNPDIPVWMLNVAIQRQGLYQRTQRFEDLVDAIHATHRAVSVYPLGHPLFVTLLGWLGAWYTELFQCGDVSYKGMQGATQDNLHTAVRLLDAAIELSPEPERQTLLEDLGTAQLLGSLVDEAIGSWERAMELGPLSSINQYNLGIHYGKRFKRTGDPQDVDRMVQTLRDLVEKTSQQDGEPHFTLGLGSALLDRYDLTNEMSDLDGAISYLQLAREMMGVQAPLSHKEMPHFLSKALMTRYDRTGDPRNVEEAILVLQQAVRTPGSEPYRTVWLRYLMLALRSRYSHTQDLQDIREAVSVGRRAASDIDHPRLHNTLFLLASSLRILHQREKRREELEEAIAIMEWSLGALPPDTPEPTRQEAMHELALGYSARSQDSNDALANLDKGLSILGNENSRGLVDDGRLVYQLKDRAHLRMERFKLTGAPLDIAGAIEDFRKVVDRIPDGHSGLVNALYGLGMALKSQYEINAEVDDLLEALECMRRAALADAVGDTHLRFTAAKEWSVIAFRLQGEASTNRATAVEFSGDSWLAYEDNTVYVEDALQGMEVGMRLIPPLMSPARPLGRRSQAIKTNAIDAFTLMASSFAVWLGRTAAAVEWMEQGRCLLWNQLNSLRSPLADLHSQHPELAARFLEVSKSLEKTSLERKSETRSEVFENRVSLQAEAKRHADIAKEWEGLVHTIHSLPGFDDFLAPSPYSRLCSSIPSNGFVVLLNFQKSFMPIPQHSMASAIILSRHLEEPTVVRFRSDLSEIMHELLPAMKYELMAHEFLPQYVQGDQGSSAESTRAIGRYRRIGKGSFPLGSQGMIKLLEFLWRSVAEPIVKTIGLEPSVSPTARIWWCLTGSLPFIPVHAAGVYGDGGQNTLAHYAVSSYIPTISSLGRLSDNPWSGTPNVEGCLTVSVPNAPGQTYLPGATHEARLIKGLMHDQGVAHSILEGHLASKVATVQNMDRFSCIHLACHATQNPKDPLRSKFYLQDGSLDLSTIIKANLPSADLAFLSACQTSRGDEKLTEEALHLAAGMLAAGYRSVVATMWSIRDMHAPGVAESFYAYLLRKSADNGRAIDGSHAAYAIHHATRELREKLDLSNESFLSWVPYVHWGL